MECERDFPNAYDLTFRHGKIAVATGRFNEAVEYFERSIALRPDKGECSLALAQLLQSDHQIQRATEYYRRALDTRANWRPAMLGLATCLLESHNFTEVLQICDQLIERDRDDVEALRCKGLALLKKGFTDEAIKNLQRIVYLRPHDASDHQNLGMALLSAQRFEQGWVELEWRLRVSGAEVKSRAARWMGQSLDGKTILLVEEPDVGLTIQFLRLTRMLRDKGGRVIVVCRPWLKPLLEQCPDLDEVISTGDALPKHDFFCNIMSTAIGLQIQSNNIPQHQVFPSHRNRSSDVQTHTLHEGKLRIGVAVDGRNPSHGVFDVRDLRDATVDWIELPSLPAGGPGHGSQVNATQLSDIVLQMRTLDGVIINNVEFYAHLAGAVGLRTLSLFQNMPSWSWASNDERALWYPNTTVRWTREWDDARLKQETDKWLGMIRVSNE